MVVNIKDAIIKLPALRRRTQFREAIIHYVGGTQYNESGDSYPWSNLTNAFDKTDSTFSDLTTIPKVTDSDVIQATTIDSLTGYSGDISKVEIGFCGYASIAGFDTYLQTYYPSGFGDTYNYTDYPLVNTDYWVDVTDEYLSDADAPNPWTWSDLSTLELYFYVTNTSTSDGNFYVDNIKVRVGYYA